MPASGACSDAFSGTSNPQQDLKDAIHSPLGMKTCQQIFKSEEPHGLHGRTTTLRLREQSLGNRAEK